MSLRLQRLLIFITIQSLFIPLYQEIFSLFFSSAQQGEIEGEWGRGDFASKQARG